MGAPNVEPGVGPVGTKGATVATVAATGTSTLAVNTDEARLNVAAPSGALPSGAQLFAGMVAAPDTLVRNAPLRRAFVAAGIIETGGELFNFYMPIYGHSIDLSASLIGIILGTYAVAVLMTRLVMSALVKRSSEEGVLCLSLALAAVACTVFPFVTSVPMLAAISFVLGLGLGCCGPLSMVITYNRAPAGRSGEAMGLRQSFNKFTEVLVPLIFGTVGSAAGIGAAFWMDAALLAGGSWILRQDWRRREVVAQGNGR